MLGNWPGFIIQRKRDLTLVRLTDGQVMVIGCDSAGAIGPKPLDVIKVPGFITGKFTARVALMDVVSVGATPVCVVNTLCVEPEPVGGDIIRGISAEVMALGLDPKIVVTGSTEKNIHTSQTGVGVTVVGLVAEEGLRLGRSRSGDAVVCVGLPKVGYEVLESQEDIMDLPALKKILELECVHEILPVGSSGIAREAETLAELAGCAFSPAKAVSLDLTKSAGPSTCVLVSLEPGSIPTLRRHITKPVELIGQLFGPCVFEPQQIPVKVQGRDSS